MLRIESEIVYGKRIYAFKTKEEFLKYIENERRILVALNAEKLNKNIVLFNWF